MRRVTIVVPYLVSDPEVDSALRPLPAALRELVEGGQVFKLNPMPASSCPEAAFLGLDPREHPIAQGPLTVAALGHRPPEGSVHFHLTLGTVNSDATVGALAETPTARDLNDVFGAVARLKTRTLTPLQGEGTDHALVLEGGTVENATTPFGEVVGNNAYKHMPCGGGEHVLRQFIDDAVNVLNDLEFNHVRIEEGLPPLNLLWPWGQGFRPNLPNLPLRRGDVAVIESDSMRMEGLARLVGYKHGDRSTIRQGMAFNWKQFAATSQRTKLSLALANTVREMQEHGRVDEIAWTLEQLSKDVIEPLLFRKHEDPFEIRLVAPGGHSSVEPAPPRASRDGLGLFYSSQQSTVGTVPFDERALDEPKLRSLDVPGFVLGGLIGQI